MVTTNSLKKDTVLSEYEECKLLAQYLTLNGLKFAHIPNETFTPHWGVKAKNKAMGVSSGFPDYAIIIGKTPFSKLLFIEMKRSKGGVISDKQKSWLEDLNKCEGVYATTCNGFEEAKAVVEQFRRLNITNNL